MIVTDCRVSGLGDQARNLRFAFRHAGLNAGRRVKYPGFLPEFRCPFFVAIAGFEKRVAAKGVGQIERRGFGMGAIDCQSLRVIR